MKSLVAFSLLVACASFVSAEEKVNPQLLLIENKATFTVVGDEGYFVNDFMEAYQTVLWPEWRTATGEGAEKNREMMDNFRRDSWKTKRGVVSSSDKLTKDAFWETVRIMHKRGYSMEIRTASRN